MDNKVAIIEGIYDLCLPGVPTSLHRWGRVVWLHNIEVGMNGQLLFVKDGKLRMTSLSRISNIIKTKNYFEVHTQSSLYKLRYLY
ncbi:MAG TPA: hypothetical protein VIM51_00370 [Desulfosporosinus sp.]